MYHPNLPSDSYTLTSMTGLDFTVIFTGRWFPLIGKTTKTINFKLEHYQKTKLSKKPISKNCRKSLA